MVIISNASYSSSSSSSSSPSSSPSSYVEVDWRQSESLHHCVVLRIQPKHPINLMMMLIDLHRPADHHHGHGGDHHHVQDLDDDDHDEHDSYDDVYEKEEDGGIESNQIFSNMTTTTFSDWILYFFVLFWILLLCPFWHFLKPFWSPQWHWPCEAEFSPWLSTCGRRQHLTWASSSSPPMTTSTEGPTGWQTKSNQMGKMSGWQFAYLDPRQNTGRIWKLCGFFIRNFPIAALL